jgi:hypothetical protein
VLVAWLYVIAGTTEYEPAVARLDDALEGLLELVRAGRHRRRDRPGRRRWRCPPPHLTVLPAYRLAVDLDL